MPPRPTWLPLALTLTVACAPPPAVPPQALVEAPQTSAPDPPPPPPPAQVASLTLAPLPGCTVAPGQILEEPTIVGSLDDQAVREAVYQQLDRISECVGWAVGYDLFAPGQLVVRLAVAPAGRVSTVEMASDATGGDPEIHSCLEAAFADLVFPRTSTVTWVCYPINVAY